MARIMKNEPETSWGPVADWYDRMLESDAQSYQNQVVLPGLLGLMEADGLLGKSDKVIDIACGQGFFSRALAQAGAGEVVGVDISAELVDLANKNSQGQENLDFQLALAHKLAFAKNNYFSRATIILALDNIREFKETLAETARVLAPGGRLYIVINHPAFRVIGASSWGFDDRSHSQYRRLDAYMSESNKKVVMNPGKAESAATVTFHRPISIYASALAEAGFQISIMEEWLSHKKSEPGVRAKAEDKAREEFPLFLAIAARK